jgi:hypothetical protein
MKLSDFNDSPPELVLEDYFQGTTKAWGLFEDRFGTVRRQFTVDITGTWENGVLTLDEHFTYADGEKSRRVWRLTKTGETTYEGRADDVIGIAEGERAGNAFRFEYSLNLPVGDSTWRVNFDDWMFLQPGGVMLNRATVSRWGIEIGRVTLSFAKPEAPITEPPRQAARPQTSAAE